MNKHSLKGNCSRKGIHPAGHPWRKAVYPWAARSGRYTVDAARIEERISQRSRPTQPESKAGAFRIHAVSDTNASAGS
jgi:hypothetical protein